MDDSQLVRDMDVAPSDVEEALVPTAFGDIGERMILVPALANPDIAKSDVCKMVQAVVAQGKNAVVLVPSFRAAEWWAKQGATVARNETIDQEVLKLGATGGNFVVLVNRYDGIDLPDESCRVLVVDGLPVGNSLHDVATSTSLSSSRRIKNRLAQKVEQGMGRAVRSQSDYCAVLLVGSDLVKFISTRDVQSRFSAETRSQVQLGIQICRKAKQTGHATAAIEAAIQRLIERNEKWIRQHKANVARSVEIGGSADQRLLARAERDAYANFCRRSDQEAGAAIAAALDQTSLDDSERAWYLQLQARYLHRVDPSRSQELQLRAHQLNSGLFKPLGGVKSVRASRVGAKQNEEIRRWVVDCVNENAVILALNDAVAGLTFGLHHKECEAKTTELGRLLGLDSWRPEQEEGRGPDVCWELGIGTNLLLEMKSEVEVTRTEISKSECGQLQQHLEWANDRWPARTNSPLMFHPASRVADDAFPSGLMVMDQRRSDAFKRAVGGFAASLAQKAPDAWTADEIGSQLVAHRLNEPNLTSWFHPVRKR